MNFKNNYQHYNQIIKDYKLKIILDFKIKLNFLLNYKLRYYNLLKKIKHFKVNNLLNNQKLMD